MNFSGDPLMRILSKDQLFLKKDNQFMVYPMEGSKSTRGMQVANIQWSSLPSSVTINMPYLIAVIGDALSIYSMESWKQFQVLDPQIKGVKSVIHTEFTHENIGGVSTEDFLVGYSEKSVFALVALPFEYQADSLMRKGHIEDALRIYQETASQDPQFQERMDAFYEQGAWKKLLSLEFEKAFEYFEKASFSPITLLNNTFPYLVMKDSLKTYTNMEIDTIIKKKKTYLSGNAELNKYIRAAEADLYLYLDRSKDSDKCKEDLEALRTIHTAMFIILLNTKPSDLSSFLKPIHVNTIAYDDILEYCKKHKQDYGLGWLYYKFQLFKESLEIWKNIRSSDKGSSFDGIQETVIVLKTTDSMDLIREYSLKIFNQDKALFLTIFTHRFEGCTLPEDDVVSFLTQLGYDVAIDYLKWIVFETGRENAKSQHALIQLYLKCITLLLPSKEEDIIKMMETNTVIPTYRNPLIHLLKTKKEYEPEVVLSSIYSLPLFSEKVILLQRMKEHEKALAILVEKINDDDAALKYCQEYNKSSQEDLYLVLLNVYITLEKDLEVPKRAIQFLDQHANDMDAVEAIKLIPSSMPLHLVYPFLSKTIRKTKHKLRQGNIMKSLELEENVKMKQEKYKLLKKFVTIYPDDVCAVCKKHIGDKVFARYPNGTVVHYKCYQDMENAHVCPVTQRNFLTHPM